LSVLSYAPGVVATEMQADIRAADPALFPRRRRFVELHANGDLVAPELPAADLAARLDGAAGEPYEAVRFAR
jgi:hypothetical protein